MVVDPLPRPVPFTSIVFVHFAATLASSAGLVVRSVPSSLVSVRSVDPSLSASSGRWSPRPASPPVLRVPPPTSLLLYVTRPVRGHDFSCPAPPTPDRSSVSITSFPIGSFLSVVVTVRRAPLPTFGVLLRGRPRLLNSAGPSPDRHLLSSNRNPFPPNRIYPSYTTPSISGLIRLTPPL